MVDGSSNKAACKRERWKAGTEAGSKGMERGERKRMENGETGIEAETESDAILLNQRLGF
jgi:hypothetical protein